MAESDYVVPVFAAAAMVLTAVGAWLGGKLGEWDLKRRGRR